MRGLKVLTAVMGVLIVLGTTVLVVTIVKRVMAPAAVPAPVRLSGPVLLDEPAGTRIATMVAVGDRLALQLQGGGADRIVLVDPRSGAVTGRISLAR